MALVPKAVSLVSSACEAGGGEQLPTVIGRKGETESEREKQFKDSCIRAARGRACDRSRVAEGHRVSLGLASQ